MGWVRGKGPFGNSAGCDAYRKLTESLLFLEQKNDTNEKGHHEARKGVEGQNRAGPCDNSLDKSSGAVYFL